MNLIVNADRNWAIGKDNKLLVSIPQDMKFFREMTTGKVVVMGRRTLESFPGGRPLKDRTNIVLTTDRAYEAEGAVIVHSMEELLEELKKYPADQVFVIAGRASTGPSFPCAGQPTSRGRTRPTMRTPGSRIWTRILSGS